MTTSDLHYNTTGEIVYDIPALITEFIIAANNLRMPQEDIEIDSAALTTLPPGEYTIDTKEYYCGDNDETPNIEICNASRNTVYDMVVNDRRKWYQYNSKGLVMHDIDSDDNETWWEYDIYQNTTHYKQSNGYEKWYRYDTNNHCIWAKTGWGECLYEYDSDGNMIHKKEDRIRVENSTEAWHVYGADHKHIYSHYNDGREEWYDSNGTLFRSWCNGKEHWYKSDGLEIYSYGASKRYTDALTHHLSRMHYHYI